MNAPFKPTDRIASEIAAAERVADIAANYARHLKALGKRSTSTEWDCFQLCNAIIDLFDDGDALSARQIIMDENGWDEHGNPVRSEPYGGVVPYVERVSPSIFGAAR